MINLANDSDSSSNGSLISDASCVIEATISTTIDVGRAESDVDAATEDGSDRAEQQWSTPMEDEQMSKARTIHLHKTEAILREAIDNGDPMVGIVIESATDGEPKTHAVHKITGKKFGWMRLAFNDAKGVPKCGLWFARPKQRIRRRSPVFEKQQRCRLWRFQ